MKIKELKKNKKKLQICDFLPPRDNEEVPLTFSYSIICHNSVISLNVHKHCCMCRFKMHCFQILDTLNERPDT